VTRPIYCPSYPASLPSISTAVILAWLRVMVSMFSFLRRFISARKRSPDCILSADTSGSPPEYGQVCGSAPLVSEKASLPSCEDSSLLNPNLRFTANEIEGHLVQQDTAFAAAVVELMLPRLKLGVWKEPVGWGHYSYTVEKVFPCLPGFGSPFELRGVAEIKG
jgi:hypothetical protein